MNDFSTAETSPPTVPTDLATLLHQQGLSIPAPERDSRSRPGPVACYAAYANEMDPLDLPPGDAYRAYARRDGRKRDPAKDGVRMGTQTARIFLIQIAPDGVWWFRAPCLVVRDWDCESEGRGPFVVVDGRTNKPITASSVEELAKLAREKRFDLGNHQYRIEDESLVLTLARQRGIYWD
jgi:hypothetical protein